MLTRRIIPCLDVSGGRIVKGVRFAGLRDAGDPAERAALYQDQGADEIVLLDVGATVENRAAAVETVRRVRERLSIPLTVGGGVRCESDASRLLEAGADKVGVNSAAVARPELLAELADRYGRQCVVIAIDGRRADDRPGWDVVVRSGRDRTGIDAVRWAAQATEIGAGEILLTSWDRDGSRAGYDLALIAEVVRRVSVPVVASGGAAGPSHFLEALEAGADAVLAASIFHDDRFTVSEVKSYLLERSVRVRP